jgi:integrase/recombinase XerD
LPSNHQLHQFLTFLKHERGFADATIVNREHSLRPFLAWLVAQDVPLSTVSPVVITKYFTSAVAGRWKRTTISFHVYSLRSFFRFATNRGWCAAGIAESIDAPRVYTYENLPQGPTWEEVKKLVTSVNGTSPVQIRNRCATCCARSTACGLAKSVACVLRTSIGRKKESRCAVPNRGKPKLIP